MLLLPEHIMLLFTDMLNTFFSVCPNGIWILPRYFSDSRERKFRRIDLNFRISFHIYLAQDDVIMFKLLQNQM